jgi:hypothetical protein
MQNIRGSELSEHSVEAPTTKHLRDYELDLEKYKAMQILPSRKIEIRRTTNFTIILFLELKLL